MLRGTQASYQSLIQMAYQLHGFVLDMSTTPHRGDLSKIMHTKDDGVCSKANLLFSGKAACVAVQQTMLIIIITVDNYYFIVSLCPVFIGANESFDEMLNK